MFLIQRFSRADKRNKLPKWIQEHLTDSMCNLSTEEAAQVISVQIYFPVVAPIVLKIKFSFIDCKKMAQADGATI